MMKEIQPHWIASILLIGILMTAGCSSNPTALVPASTKSVPVSVQTQTAQPAGAAQSAAAPDQANPTRGRASATATAGSPTTVSSTVALPAVKATLNPATATPPVYPTSTISAAGKLALPAQIQPVSFSKNATTTVINVINLTNGIFKAYQLNAAAGQILHIAVNGSLNLQVLDPAQNPASPVVVMPGYLNVAITSTGPHTIVLTGLGNATIGLFLPAAGDPALNAPVPSQVQAVQIPAVPLSVSFPSKGDPSAAVGYAFEAQAGQTLNLSLTGDVVPFVVTPDSNVVVPDTDPVTRQWSFFLPESGKTSLVLLGNGAISVTAKISPAQTAAPLATAQPKGAVPILINAGNPGTMLNTVFTVNQPLTYVAHLTANQVVTLTISGMAGITKISGPGDSDVELVHSMYSTQWRASISQTGDYTFVLAGSGPATIDFYIPANSSSFR